jgi:hypothetical protein
MVSALPMDQLRHLWRPGRHIGRAFTWAALTKTGTIYTEAAYASLRAVPRHADDPIVVLAVVAVADPDDESRHVRVLVPEGSEPVIFWRMRRVADPDKPNAAMTVLGFTFPNGSGVYTYVADDGHVVTTIDRYFYGD